MLLKGRDGACDGRRRAVQMSCGLCETFMLRDGDEDREGFWTDRALGPVEIHLELMIAEAR